MMALYLSLVFISYGLLLGKRVMEKFMMLPVLIL